MTQLKVGEILAGRRRLHFVGIGGSGMFPIVQILKSRGFEITGSDVNEGSIIDAERAMGIEVSIGHRAENVDGAEALVVTAALLPGNPEVERAQQLGLPIIPRAEMLGYLTELSDCPVCISGTHGKTTATSILTSILLLAGRDPSAVIGGKLPLIGGYGRAGSGRELVVEAFAFVDSFLHPSPAISVILNIDNDHLDYFGSIDGAINSFKKFAAITSQLVLANGDDPNTLRAVEDCPTGVKTFGEGEGCDYRITGVRRRERAFYSFELTGPEGRVGEFTLGAPGRHNVYNAAAAAAAALELGCSEEEIQKGIASFHGAARRFEILGQRAGVTIADDYAHHPAELRATLAAAKDMGYRRVIAVFQPFTYSRTKQHLDYFAEVLSAADLVVLTEIMGSREVNTIGIHVSDLAVKIPGSRWFSTFQQVRDYCLEVARPGDLIITLGCGDIYKAARLMLETPECPAAR